MSDKSRSGAWARRPAPTLIDVAREAGTSVSTAGRALRDSGWPVNAVLKERVTIAAARLGYVPNVLARNLRAGAPALIGLVAGNMLDPYYGEIAETVTRHAEAEHRMMAMVCNMQRDPELELRYCRQLWEHRVAGLILAGGGFDQRTHQAAFNAIIKKMVQSGIAITTLSPRRAAIPQFCVDNVRVGRMAAGELLGRGHREVGIVIGRILNEVRRQRLHGATAALGEAGATWRVPAPQSAADPQAAVGAMLDSFPGITAIITSSHMISLGVIDSIRQARRSIPADMSVVSIGNPKLARWATPKLTYIDLRLEACSRAALDYIAGRVAGTRGSESAPAEPIVVGGDSVKDLTTAASRSRRNRPISSASKSAHQRDVP